MQLRPALISARGLRCLAGVVLGCGILMPVVARAAASARPGWGSTPYHDGLGTGVTFRVWAPNARSVFVPGQFNDWSTGATPLGKEISGGVWNGVWSADVSNAVAGQQYKYYIHYPGGSIWRHDPRAREVVSSGSSAGDNDIIYDPAAFNWGADSYSPPVLDDLVIYELHIGTFYVPASRRPLPGRFIDATNRLDYLKGLGLNAVEVMPIAEFPGHESWGYNPADPYAVENFSYGGPDGFKTFVKACHERGIAVLLDVVHNHYGPGDLDLWNFDGWTGGGNGGGIYFYQDDGLCCTPYGSRPDYSRRPVRDYIADNFRMWLGEYRVDGFRWDTPGLMMDADGTFIRDAATLITGINAMIRSNYPGRIDIAEDRMGYGFDSTWDIAFHNAITPQLAAVADSNRDLAPIARALTNNIRFNVAAGLNRVVFLESHDVVGDLNNGVRLPSAIDGADPGSYRARKLSTLGAVLTFTAPGVPMVFQGEEMLADLPFSSSRPVDWSKTNTYSGIVRFYRDLIRLRRNRDGDVPGLKGDGCVVLRCDNRDQVLAYRRWREGTINGDVVVIANFGDTIRSNYAVPFPRAGDWHVHFNSDSPRYGADYGGVGSVAVEAAGTPPSAEVTIGPYSALVLSQLPWPPQLDVTRSQSQ